MSKKKRSKQKDNTPAIIPEVLPANLPALQQQQGEGGIVRKLWDMVKGEADKLEKSGEDMSLTNVSNVIDKLFGAVLKKNRGFKQMLREALAEEDEQEQKKIGDGGSK